MSPVAGAPGGAFPSEPVGRLRQEGRLTGQPGEPCSHVGELLTACGQSVLGLLQGGQLLGLRRLLLDHYAPPHVLLQLLDGELIQAALLGGPRSRIARRRGKKRAIVAVGRSILVVIWALLSDEQAQFVDLGPDFYAAHTNPERKVRQHVRERQALGYSVTLNPAASPRDTGFSDQAALGSWVALLLITLVLPVPSDPHEGENGGVEQSEGVDRTVTQADCCEVSAAPIAQPGGAVRTVLLLSWVSL